MSRHKNVSARRRAALADPKRVRFSDALEDLLKGFRPDTKSEVALETQLANFKAERPALFESRHVREASLARAIARPREEVKPRPRVAKREQARAAEKAMARL